MAEHIFRPIDALTLRAKKFPPPEWVIPNVVPEGTTLLVSNPKVGKSWWALQIGRALAANGANVLYIGLEDTQETMQERKHMQPGSWSSRFEYIAPGDIDQMPKARQSIARWIHERPRPKLVIVDTLAMLCGAKHGDSDLYRSDYHTISDFKTLADKYKLSFLLLHHTNKTLLDEDDDPFHAILGTQGLRGAVDTSIILYRQLTATVGRIRLESRRARALDEEVSYDPQTHLWGLAPPVAAESNPLEQAVVQLVAVRGPLPRAAVWRALVQETGAPDREVLDAITDALEAGEIAERDGCLIRVMPLLASGSS